MGRIGYGYGSEWHLLRYLGRHRHKLDQAILKAIGQGDCVEWLDFGFDPDVKFFDVELKGLGFLREVAEPQYAAVFEKWRKEFWPQTGTPPNWDAVGWLASPDSNRELILVEAKAHTGELKSKCQATGDRSRRQIEDALTQTITYAGAQANVGKWLEGYYQFANRLATLYFLHKEKVAARLVLIYFLDDKFPADAGEGPYECPADKDGWKKALEEQDKHLGLPRDHPLAAYIHKVFLPVTG